MRPWIVAIANTVPRIPMLVAILSSFCYNGVVGSLLFVADKISPSALKSPTTQESILPSPLWQVVPESMTGEGRL